MAANHKFESPEPIPSYSTLQNGEHLYSQRYFEAGRLYGKNRPEGRVFQRQNFPRSQEVFEIPLERSCLPIQSSPFWFGHSTQSLFKDHARSDEDLTGEEHTTHSVSRRYFDLGQLPRSTQEIHQDGSTVPANTGFHLQLQEVCVRTGSSDRIPRIQGGLSENEDSPSSTESEKYNEGMQESSSSEDSVCSQTSSPHWEDDSCNSGNLTGSSSLQSSSTAEEPNPVIQQTELLGNRNLGQRIQDRRQVVEFPSPKPQRENTCHPNGKLNDRIGCIDQGLGCILPGKESRRPLADDGKEAAHKSIGVEIGIPSAANICVQQDQHSCASTNR